MTKAGDRLVRRAAILLGVLGSSAVLAIVAWGGTYIVQQVRDERYFIINDAEFEARNRVCRFFEEGDPVVFITGDPEGRCLTAVIQNLSNGQSCELWCRDKPYQR